MKLLPEIAVIPTYKRPELLYLCVSNLRANGFEGPIAIFPDREDRDPVYYDISQTFDAMVVPAGPHGGYGNSFNAFRALFFGASSAELIHYIEDDVIVSDRWLTWTRSVHEEAKMFMPIFCSAGWVGNRSQPCRDNTYFSPWIYIPQFSISGSRAKDILKHFVPEYINDMAGYCQKHFPNSPLNRMGALNNHYEIDGLIQHIISEDQSLQVAWNGYPTVKHLGFAGYNRGGYTPYGDFFKATTDFKDRLSLITEFSLDPSWRMQYFEREIVEKEEGGKIPTNEYIYKIDLGTFSSIYSCLIPPRGILPKVINGVPIPDDAKITCVGRKSIP